MHYTEDVTFGILSSMMPWIRYVLITILAVGSLATVILIWQWLPVWLIVLTAVSLFLLVIRFTAVVQCYYMPRVQRLYYEEVLSGHSRRVAVEEVLLNAGRIYIPTKVLRISWYQADSGRLFKRQLIGDTAKWLGEKDGSLWFDNQSRFYNRHLGKIGYDCISGRLNKLD